MHPLNVGRPRICVQELKFGTFQPKRQGGHFRNSQNGLSTLIISAKQSLRLSAVFFHRHVVSPETPLQHLRHRRHSFLLRTALPRHRLNNLLFSLSQNQ
ncbi:hypothetical protein LINPERHAP1_LOCUS7099, partial [Linum perenne]